MQCYATVYIFIRKFFLSKCSLFFVVVSLDNDGLLYFNSLSLGYLTAGYGA